MTPQPNALAIALARAIRAELDRPGRCAADDPDSLLTALAIVIEAHARPCVACRAVPPTA